jgi:hypothetical protein
MSTSNLGKILEERQEFDDVNIEYHPEVQAHTISDLHDAIEDKWRQRVKKKTVEERSRRVTFLMDEDLAKRLDKIVAKKKKLDKKPGFKTMALNAMIRRCLDEFED